MGIKTKLNPMGGGTGDEPVDLTDWVYDQNGSSITLRGYTGTNDPIYVPVKGNKIKINNAPTNSMPVSNVSPFYNYRSSVNVDLQGVSYINRDMSYAFYNSRIKQVYNISSSTLNMAYAFANSSLNGDITIPEGVTNVSHTFDNCSIDPQIKSVTIPTSVTNMDYTFTNARVRELRYLSISNSVVNMSHTFDSCRELKIEQYPFNIPNSVTDLYWTFNNCVNLVGDGISIPNSVTNLKFTFSGCSSSLNISNILGKIRSSNNVYSMEGCFYSYTGDIYPEYTLPNSVVNIADIYSGYGDLYINSLPDSITNMAYAFYGRRIRNHATPNNVVNMAGVFAQTDWSSYSSSASVTNIHDVTIPNTVKDISQIFKYSNYNRNVVIPDSVINMSEAFNSADYVNNITIGNGVIDMSGAFSQSSYNKSLTIPNSVSNMTNAFYDSGYSQTLNIPVGVTNVANAFEYSSFNNGSGILVLPPTVNDISNVMFNGILQLESISNSINISGYYSNGTPLRIPAGSSNYFAGDYYSPIGLYCSQHGISVVSTSLAQWEMNFPSFGSQFYNVSETQNSVFIIGLGLQGSLDGRTITANWPVGYTKNVYICDHPLDESNRGSVVTFNLPNCIWVGNMSNAFYGATRLNTFNVKLIAASSMVGAFTGCTNFNSPINIHPGTVTNMAGAFTGCTNFNQPINIPYYVNDMAFAFLGCTNFNQPINMFCNRPESIVNMRETFKQCTKFNQPLNLPYPQEGLLEFTFEDCHDLNKPINIPDTVMNMNGTFNRCWKFNQPINLPASLVNMGNAFRDCNNFNQNITIPNSVTFMPFTFMNCYNFNQNITIPNNVGDISYTFSGCSSLNKTIKILSENIEYATGVFDRTSLPKNVYIPLTYTNGVITKTFNSFIAAGYIYENGVITNLHGVTIKDLDTYHTGSGGASGTAIHL